MKRDRIILLYIISVVITWFGLATLLNHFFDGIGFVYITVVFFVFVLLSFELFQLIEAMIRLVLIKANHRKLLSISIFPFLILIGKKSVTIQYQPQFTLSNRTYGHSQDNFKIVNTKYLYVLGTILTICVVISILTGNLLMVILLGLAFMNIIHLINKNESMVYAREEIILNALQGNIASLNRNVDAYFLKRMDESNLNYEDLTILTYILIWNYDNYESVLGKTRDQIIDYQIEINNQILIIGLLDLLFTEIYMCYQNINIQQCREISDKVTRVVNNSDIVLTAHIKSNYNEICNESYDRIYLRKMYRLFLNKS